MPSSPSKGSKKGGGSSSADPPAAGGGGSAGGAGGSGGWIASPEFLLQILKLLQRKEVLLEQAKTFNDALQELRVRGADSDEELPLKKEWAWNALQMERTNQKLRSALWSIALGMGEGEGDARKNELVAGLDGAIPVVEQCAAISSAIVEAVAGGQGLGGLGEAMGEEGEAVGGCIKLLMLLRRAEEQAVLASCTGSRPAGEVSGEWDAAFDQAMESIRPSGQDGEEAWRQILSDVESLRASMPS